MSSGGKKNNTISGRLKQYEKEKQQKTPPTAPPSKVPKNTLLNNNGKDGRGRCYTKIETSPMAQRQHFNDSAASLSMSVPEIVDLFNEQITLNEMALAQEAEEKAARRERYLESRKRNRKNARAKRALLAKKEKMKEEKGEKASNHYSLVDTSRKGGGGAYYGSPANGGLLMNGTTSFSVDPRTYRAPENLPRPTGPETQLLLQALADNVLLKEKRNRDFSDSTCSGGQVITTTTQELKDALVRAFETVLIKKGQTVEEAVEQAGSRHHDRNCLYVVESGQIDLNDGETGKRVATATAG